MADEGSSATGTPAASRALSVREKKELSESLDEDERRELASLAREAR
jgi:hypothetical protein